VITSPSPRPPQRPSLIGWRPTGASWCPAVWSWMKSMANRRCAIFGRGHNVLYLAAFAADKRPFGGATLIDAAKKVITVDIDGTRQQYRCHSAAAVKDKVGIGGPVGICGGYMLRAGGSYFSILGIEEKSEPCRGTVFK
jgi:hypothetical protein